MAIKAFSEIKESNMVSNPEFSSSTLSHIIANFYYTSMRYLDCNPNYYHLANSICRVHPYFSCRCALLVCVVQDRNGGNISFLKKRRSVVKNHGSRKLNYLLSVSLCVLLLRFWER